MSRQLAKPIEIQLDPGHPFYGIVQEAYHAFASPKPVSVGVCTTCCMNVNIVADFFTHPINRLPLNYLQDWYSAAYDPSGVPKDTWTYLLPRILEGLAADEELSYNGYEVVLRPFQSGKPGSWAADQWDVLDRFQRMFLTAKIDHNDQFLDDVLCMFFHGGWTLDGLIGQLRSYPDEKIVECFWRDWCKLAAPGLERIWLTPFWDEAERATVFNFYRSQELCARMEAVALSDSVAAELAAKASAVVSVIEANADMLRRR
jgi:hypothetical protein